jgi:YggT family protein
MAGLGAFFIVFVRFLIIALYLVLLGRVLMSWVNPRFEGPLGRFLYDTTEPFLAPIRRVLPKTGMFDLSPIVAFLILSAIAVLLRVG